MSLNLSNKNIEDDDNIFNEINNPEKYISIDLSHNLLTTLPKNLSLFSNLKSLNITNNKFKNYQEIAISLSTLPELQDLNIDLATQENVIIILTTLPNLVKLNGQNTTDTTLQQSFLSQSNLTNIFFPGNISNNLNNINNSGINLNNNSEYKLNEILTNNENNENKNNFNEKNDISLNEETNTFEYIYKQLNNESFNKKFQIKLRDEISKINRNLDISNNLYNAIIVKSKLEIYSFILYEVLNLIINNNNYINNISSLNIIKKIINIVKEKLTENQNILFNLVINNKNKSKNNINKENDNKMNNKYFISENNKLTNDLNEEKIISKSELISLLNEVFEYNIKQNEKYNKLNLSKESLFDSIIPYLTIKFGLKSIALQWNKKIIEGINNYYKIDSEINLFKKIFERKIDDSFYLNYIELKSTCSNLLFKFLKEKNEHKSNLEIDNLLKDKLNNFISYEEWNKIINNIYEYNNKDEIINEIINFINKNNLINELYQKNNDSDINKLSISFDDFIKVLLEIHINLREKYLNRLSNNFKICDKDNDGYINIKEFEELIRSFKSIYFINNKLIENLINKIEPFEKNKISFNHCVEILSEKNIDNKSILDFLQFN